MAIKKVITVCPYCASGCKIHLLVENNKIVGAEGANGKTNEGELCLKGYYGWDFVHDTKILTPRLTQPMIRYKRGEPFTPGELGRSDFLHSKTVSVKSKKSTVTNRLW